MIAVLFNESDKKIIALLQGEIRLEENNLISESGSLRGINWDIADYLAFDIEVVKEVVVEEEFRSYFEPAYLSDALIAQGYKLPKPEPPLSTHISTIDAIDAAKAKPVRIKRTWHGKDYFYDCFVTESVKDQYVVGDVKVGDYVIVHFDDIGEQVVTAKVYKSW